MSLTLPRVALGAADARTNHHPTLWAVLDQLDEAGVQVQVFRSQACFARHDGAQVVTGRPSRHLDSWIMDAEVSTEVLRHGAHGVDVAVVEGSFTSQREDPCRQCGGSLRQLTDWLDLTRVGVLDVTSVDDCLLRPPAGSLEGLLLDCVASPAEAIRWRTRMETLWGIPVLGYLEECPHVRAILDRLPSGVRPSRELCRALGDSLRLYGGVDAFLNTCGERPPLPPSPQLFRKTPDAAHHMAGLRVAVAYDEAFGCYFPDTLDLLEAAGALVVDFSPLTDETLPDDCDVVYLGCGGVHRVARKLANNPCMMLSLRKFAHAGGRIYAEGAGLAYLCRQMVLPGGAKIEMAGLLPATAYYQSGHDCVQPVSVQLQHDSWLGRTGRELRGYANPCWHIEADSPLALLSPPGPLGCDLLGVDNVIGSRIHLSLVGQPHLLKNFLAVPVA